MSDLLEKTGKIVFLRAHDLGTAYGPPNDQLDVEAVFILNALGDGAYGFQLRDDDNLPARQAMFSLLRDAFVHNLTVIADYLIDPRQDQRDRDPRRADPADRTGVAAGLDHDGWPAAGSCEEGAPCEKGRRRKARSAPSARPSGRHAPLSAPRPLGRQLRHGFPSLKLKSKSSAFSSPNSSARASRFHLLSR
jgi:hypothetical protein